MASGLLLSASPAEAFSAGGRVAIVRAAPYSSPLRPLRVEVPLTPRSQPAVVASAARSTPARPRASFAARVARTALWCLSSMLALVFTSARLAFAAAKTASPAISGDVLKYGFVGGCIALGYVFRGKDEPQFMVTEGAIDRDPDTLKPIVEEEDGQKVKAAAPPPAAAFTDDAPVSFDDSDLFGALNARMQSLADDKTAGPAEDDVPAPPADSTDGWGTGDTAVLEPPSAGASDAPRDVFDGDTSVEFPTGFPLRDGEVVEVDNTPSASADQIAMLSRMFGEAAPEEPSE